VAGNAGASGPFAPLVGVVRNAMGVKEFNQLRGKMISLHSQGAPPALPLRGEHLHRSAQSCVDPAMPLWVPDPTCGPVCAVIKNFCQQIGADTKQVQGLIRLAKKNGEKLGFLA
jgi:hypothetical protein